ncbi:type II toxin-antitoxin system RelE/ParE family toxin [soil metagenome]
MESRRILYLGTSKDDLGEFPHEVQEGVLYALEVARLGGKASSAIPLNGFGVTQVFEIKEPFDGDTYRAVYLARFRDALYVLHAFQKKSKSGKAIPRLDREMIERRLKLALRDAGRS